MGWRSEAACNQIPWDFRAWFFGDGDPAIPIHEQHERARMLCYLCPVQFECLSYWLDTDESYGVWGGLTVSQRKRYLMPKLRKKGADRNEVFTEVLWNLGERIYPKIMQLFKDCEIIPPELPVLEPLPSSTLVEILGAASHEDAQAPKVEVLAS